MRPGHNELVEVLADARRTILIVEDDECCATTLEIGLLLVPGVDIRIVGSARDALDLLQSADVSILITDLRLPKTDGFELISRLRAGSRTKNLPIIVISADPNSDARSRALRLGANAYFGKPYSIVSLRHKVAQLLDSKTKTTSA